MHENVVLVWFSEYCLKSLASKGSANIYVFVNKHGEMEATLNE